MGVACCLAAYIGSAYGIPMARLSNNVQIFS